MTDSTYTTSETGVQGVNSRKISKFCSECGYKLSDTSRCSQCDYEKHGSDGPWPEGHFDQSRIWQADLIWDTAKPLSTDESAFGVVAYLAHRRLKDIALQCDQLRRDFGPSRILGLRMGPIQIARVWHVHRGFIGVHGTEIIGDQRDRRRTRGVCKGGGVWFGSIGPDGKLVVGEGIETTLSAMILFGISAGVATLGTAGLKALMLPAAARRVVIAADNDRPLAGKKVGVGLLAARTASSNWQELNPRLDVEIKLAPPPQPDKDSCDWNDVLMESSYV